MRINSHTHIFTLQTALTPHAVTVLAERVRRLGLPDFVAEAVEQFLNEQVARPEYHVEEELLERLLRAISKTAGFKRFAAAAADLPVEVKVLGGDLPALGASALRSTLDRLSSQFDQGAKSEATIVNVFETLRLAMQPDMVGVADRLLEPMGAEGGLVALALDITSQDTAEDDKPQFLAQIKATSDAAVARPGRIFPFVGVNTRRPGYFDFMRRAVEERGFVGVKLYPSLDSMPTATKTLRVCNYCADHDLPILLHCSQAGFYESKDKTENGNPAHWRSILDDRPGLRVCFAHAGGLNQGQLTEEGPQAGQWAHTLVDLMMTFDEVYTDLSFHVDQMKSSEAERNYLAWLRTLLDEPRLRERVLFGTDGWLVHLRLPEAHFWHWFETHLTAAEMQSVAEEAPRQFLGLPDANGHGMRPNIRRLVDFLTAQPAVGDDPPAWLRRVADTSFTVRSRDPAWTPNNHAHTLTHAFFKRYMTAPQKRLAFEAAGALRLRQLTYWHREHVSESTFHADCRAVALALASLCRASRATFEGTYDDDSAVDRLADLAADGEKTLAEAGATVDALFRFSTETV